MMIFEGTILNTQEKQVASEDTPWQASLWHSDSSGTSFSFQLTSGQFIG
jgi:hypothetical protein